MFQQLALKVDYILRKFGMTLSGRSYIMCRSVLAAGSRDALLGLRAVSMGQVQSKDVPLPDD